MTTGKLIIGVAGGILLAAAIIFFIARESGPDETECQIQRLEAASGARSAYDVDSACL